MGKILGFDSYKRKNKNSSGAKELYMADSYPDEESFGDITVGEEIHLF